MRVEVVRTGDAPLDERTQALVLAAREAMANAARHAGVDEVSVFLDAADGVVSLYVRDRGVGFDPDAIADDRQGVAESIRGRMERVGGVAASSRRPAKAPNGASLGRRLDGARRAEAPAQPAPRHEQAAPASRPRGRSRPLPRRRPRGARPDGRGRRRGGLGRGGRAADQGARSGRRAPRRAPAGRRRPRGDHAGHSRPARREVPRAVRVGRGRRRDRGDPRRRARVCDEGDLGR